MASKKTRNGESMKNNTNTLPIQVLLIDDDSTCLSIISGLLKRNNYEVITMKNPEDALCALRMKHDKFDIVMAEVHLPIINGFQLVQKIDEEFGLPVVLMSADTKEDIVLTSLQHGALFYYSKPLEQMHLEKLWQLVYIHRRDQRNQARRGAQPCELNNHENAINLDDIDEEFALLEGIQDNLEQRHSKGQKYGKDDEEMTESRAATSKPKKHKMVWSPKLHNQFLEALDLLGPDNAVPKKIVEAMNVPGLKREHIASHLQKYRIFLRRMDEANAPGQNGMPRNWNDKPIRSSFAASHFAYLMKNCRKPFPQASRQQPIRIGASSGPATGLAASPQPNIQQSINATAFTINLGVDHSTPGSATGYVGGIEAYSSRMTIMRGENERSVHPSLDAPASSVGQRIQEEIIPKFSQVNICHTSGPSNFLGHPNNSHLAGFGMGSCGQGHGNA
ncbi:hypothetical protein Ancab_008906 [Ancistrocladus abbreviatus]